MSSSQHLSHDPHRRALVPGKKHFRVVRNWPWASGLHRISRAAPPAAGASRPVNSSGPPTSPAAPFWTNKALSAPHWELLFGRKYNDPEERAEGGPDLLDQQDLAASSSPSSSSPQGARSSRVGGGGVFASKHSVRLPLGFFDRQQHQGNERGVSASQEAFNLLYTNRGLATHPPLRLFCPPEIAIFELVPAADM